MTAEHTISEVIKKLKKDFPDITVSKVRFLEEKGLIKPKRSKSGYRLFSLADLNKLTDILSIQENEHLPLNIIKQKTDLNTYENREVDPQLLTFPTYSREELLEVTALSEKELDELIEYGLLHPSRVNHKIEYFNDIDVNLCKIVANIFELGLDARHVKHIALTARNEAILFKQLVLPQLASKRKKDIEKANKTIKNLQLYVEKLRNIIIESEV
jgi:DNA-binding transcriptional MerR regulator